MVFANWDIFQIKIGTENVLAGQRVVFFSIMRINLTSYRKEIAEIDNVGGENLFIEK